MADATRDAWQREFLGADGRLTPDTQAATPTDSTDFFGVTSPGVNTIEGALVFAGIPLAVVGIVFGAVFSTTPKPPRDESKKTKKS
ncbi:hypothetical protein [Actinoplanes subtropicus]|uniref:hypothetical protein n=1 Tax=Actinoplanes subtropicus TaxID=543632 RepID=UPI0012FBD23A|nr:hypothetical protein [Actinoplanes subtropicus]